MKILPLKIKILPMKNDDFGAIQTENNMVDRYMSNDNFYKLSQVDGRIKDPEQRICEDIFSAVFGFWSTILFNSAAPLVKLIYFSYRVGAILDHRWSVGILSFLGALTYETSLQIAFKSPSNRLQIPDIALFGRSAAGTF